MGRGPFDTPAHAGRMGAYGIGHGEWVAALGRLWPTHARHRSRADRAGRRADSPAAAVSHRWLEGLHGSVAPSRGRRVSSPAAGESGPPAAPPAGGSASPVLRPGGQGPPEDGPRRGGPQAGRGGRPVPFGQAMAPSAARRDAPDRLDGTVVWHLAGARRALAAPPAVAVLEPRSSSGHGRAHGQPRQLGAAAQESASRAHAAPPARAIGLTDHGWSSRE